MAFEYFKMQNVDIAIIEVGLGGRLDAVLRVGERLREGRINDMGTCMSSYEANPCSSCGKCKI